MQKNQKVNVHLNGKTLAWISSFLQNRTQQVLVEGVSSAIGKVTSGVPQGSVLGPTLFLLYINDIGDGIESSVRLFADDTILYRTISSPSDATILQADLDHLSDWEKKWQMGFNVDKCNALSVTLRKKPVIHNYELNGHTLERVDSAKYLGVTLTSNLNWGKHIKSIAAKANKTSAFIHRNIKQCPTRVFTDCYKTLVRPTMEYAAAVWSPHQKEFIEDLETVQKRAARRIFKDFSRDTHGSDLVEKLKLEKLKKRRNASRATMLYKVTSGNVSVNLRPGTLTELSRTRQQHGFRVPRTRTDVYLYSFFPNAIRMWNSLPDAAFSASSVESFKTAIEGWNYVEPKY